MLACFCKDNYRHLVHHRSMAGEVQKIVQEQIAEECVLFVLFPAFGCLFGASRDVSVN